MERQINESVEQIAEMVGSVYRVDITTPLNRQIIRQAILQAIVEREEEIANDVRDLKRAFLMDRGVPVKYVPLEKTIEIIKKTKTIY